MVRVNQFSVFNYIPAEAPSLERQINDLDIVIYGLDHMQFRVRKDHDSTVNLAHMVPVGGCSINRILVPLSEDLSWLVFPDKYKGPEGVFAARMAGTGMTYGNTGWIGDNNYFVYNSMLEVSTKKDDDFQLLKIWFNEWSYTKRPENPPIIQDKGTVDLRLVNPS